MSAAPAPATSPPSALSVLSRAGRTLVVGVLNTTPDSFSDGGRWLDPEAALAHGEVLLAEGADVLDVGGESTRPGAGRVAEAEELERVLPVVRALAARGAVVSIDTTRAAVAAAALEAGAAVVNDVSGALADPAMAEVVAGARAWCVLSHWRGPSAGMDALARYDAPGGVLAEVRDHLRRRVDALVAAGAAPERLVVDPGLGFAKGGEHDWALLAGLPELVGDGVPVLVGASRKRFLGTLLDGRPPAGRDDATAAVSALAAAAGAWGVRVHAVRASADAVRVAARWRPPAGAAPATAAPAASAISASAVDRVELLGLRARGRHGVLDAERALGQEFSADVVLHVRTATAAVTDDLADAVDYSTVAAAVVDVLAGEPVSLLESLAQRVAEVALAPAGVAAVDVAVHKPSAPLAVPFGDVVVRVHRRRGQLLDAVPARPVTVVLGLGANAGDPASALASAVTALAARPELGAVQASPVVQSAPVGGPPQPDYLNAVVRATTSASPRQVLAACRAVEAAHGRDEQVRARETRWGPRTLDVDLLTYGDLVASDGPVAADGLAGADAPLALPHPRAAARAFVLAPWAALAPGDVLPGAGRVDAALADLLERDPAQRAGVRPRPDVLLPRSAGERAR